MQESNNGVAVSYYPNTVDGGIDMTAKVTRVVTNNARENYIYTELMAKKKLPEVIRMARLEQNRSFRNTDGLQGILGKQMFRLFALWATKDEDTFRTPQTEQNSSPPQILDEQVLKVYERTLYYMENHHSRREEQNSSFNANPHMYMPAIKLASSGPLLDPSFDPFKERESTRDFGNWIYGATLGDVFQDFAKAGIEPKKWVAQTAEDLQYLFLRAAQEIFPNPKNCRISLCEDQLNFYDAIGKSELIKTGASLTITPS